jgi:hypothetical protein
MKQKLTAMCGLYFDVNVSSEGKARDSLKFKYNFLKTQSNSFSRLKRTHERVFFRVGFLETWRNRPLEIEKDIITPGFLIGAHARALFQDLKELMRGYLKNI